MDGWTDRQAGGRADRQAGGQVRTVRHSPPFDVRYWRYLAYKRVGPRCPSCVRWAIGRVTWRASQVSALGGCGGHHMCALLHVGSIVLLQNRAFTLLEERK